MTSNAAIIDFSFLGDVIKFSIEKLGIAGLVLSICFVLVAVLVVTFRWNAINSNQRFVLIAGLVLLVFGLAGWVVYHSDSHPIHGEEISTELLSLSSRTPIDFFNKRYNAISEQEYGLKDKLFISTTEVFKYSDYMLSENPTLRLKRYSYSEPKFLLTTLFLLDKRAQTSTLIAYLVFFKDGLPPEKYSNFFKSRFGIGARFLETAANLYSEFNDREKRRGTGEKSETPDLIILADDFPYAVTKSLDESWFLVFWLDKQMKQKDGCPVDKFPWAFSLKALKGCDLKDGRQIGFAHFLDLGMQDWTPLIDLYLGTPTLETSLFIAPNSQ